MKNAFGKGVRVCSPFTGLFNCHRSAKTDVQSRKPLLSVQHRSKFTVGKGAQLGAVWRVAFMIILDEAIELEVRALLGLYIPEKERAKWITLHKAVKQPANLVRLPDELTLDCRKDIEIVIAHLGSRRVGLGWPSSQS